MLDEIVGDKKSDGVIAERIRPLLASTTFSLRAASTALDRLRVESPALAQIAQLGDVWMKVASEIEELVQYAGPEFVFEALIKFRNAAENARRCRERLKGEPFASGTVRRKILAKNSPKDPVPNPQASETESNLPG